MAKPQGEEDVGQPGHREYVGGRWEEIGRLQFQFLKNEGLEPTDVLLDIGCGSLRGGVHLIPYLERGHYLGIEKERELIERGIREEIGQDLQNKKEPSLVVSAGFEFEQFDRAPDVAIAHSLFTHLPEHTIELCFRKLRPTISADGVFYATFFEADHKMVNLLDSQDHARFFYTRDDIKRFGTEHGFAPEYIGDWGHPRGQRMVAYRPS